jgi:hypothetical protein
MKTFVGSKPPVEILAALKRLGVKLRSGQKHIVGPLTCLLWDGIAKLDGVESMKASLVTPDVTVQTCILAMLGARVTAISIRLAVSFAGRGRGQALGFDLKRGAAVAIVRSQPEGGRVVAPSRTRPGETIPVNPKAQNLPPSQDPLIRNGIL